MCADPDLFKLNGQYTFPICLGSIAQIIGQVRSVVGDESDLMAKFKAAWLKSVDRPLADTTLFAGPPRDRAGTSLRIRHLSAKS